VALESAFVLPLALSVLFRPLSLYSLAVTVLTTKFNIKNFYMVLTMHLCVVYGSRNKRQICLYSINRLVLYKPGVECLLRGTH
jgi:hypothetical protein